MNGFILLPLYIAALGGTEVEIGIVMGLYNAVGIVCQPLIGPWTDAVGRRPFMLVGVALVIFAALVSTVAPSILLLAFVRAVQGLGFSCFFVSNYSFVIDLVPPARRGWALGIYGVAGLTATAIAPLLGEWVIRRLGFRALFTMAAAVAAVAGWIVLGLREQGRATPRPVQGFLWERGALGEVFRLSMGVTVFFGLGAGTIFVFLPTFAESLGVQTLALFYTAYALAAIGVRVFGGRLIDTRGRRAVIVPSMLMQAVATALLAIPAVLVARTSQTPVGPVLFLAGLPAGGGPARQRVAPAKPAREPRRVRRAEAVLAHRAGTTLYSRESQGKRGGEDDHKRPGRSDRAGEFCGAGGARAGAARTRGGGREPAEGDGTSGS